MLAWVVALIVGKAVIVLLVVRLLGYSLRIATMTGLGLRRSASSLSSWRKTGLEPGLLPDADYQKFLAASIISMVATPFLIKAAPRIGYAIQSALSRRTRSLSRP